MSVHCCVHDDKHQCTQTNERGALLFIAPCASLCCCQNCPATPLPNLNAPAALTLISWTCHASTAAFPLLFPQRLHGNVVHAPPKSTRLCGYWPSIPAHASLGPPSQKLPLILPGAAAPIALSERLQTVTPSSYTLPLPQRGAINASQRRLARRSPPPLTWSSCFPWARRARWSRRRLRRPVWPWPWPRPWPPRPPP